MFIEGGAIWQERESAGKAFVVKEATVTQHRAYFVRQDSPDEPTGVTRREPHGAQAIKGGANLGWLSAAKLKSDQLPHSPFAAKPAIESQWVLPSLSAGQRQSSVARESNKSACAAGATSESSAARSRHHTGWSRPGT